MDNPAEHLEQVEAKDSGLTGFDRRVAVTMAIVAALLATVSMLGQNADNDAIAAQADAGIKQTESGIKHTEATDAWGFYQAKNIRMHHYKAFLVLLRASAKDPEHDADLKKDKSDWEAQVKKYEKELPGMQQKAEELTRLAKEKSDESIKLQEESKALRAQGDHLDFSELALQLALILSSIAVLTKKAPFWYGGLAAGVVGVALAALALLR